MEKKIQKTSPFLRWIVTTEQRAAASLAKKRITAKKEAMPNFSGFWFPAPGEPHYRAWRRGLLKAVKELEAHNKKIAELNKNKDTD